MKKLLLLNLIFPLCLLAQPDKFSAKAGLVKIYSQAISDFIKVANAEKKAGFDTLFIAKRANGLPDDFPDIQLPATIEKTQILLIAPELGEKLQKERKSRIYVNLMGWVSEESAEFIFVVFSNGFNHQYDYHIHYTYNTKQNRFELSNIQYKGPPFYK